MSTRGDAGDLCHRFASRKGAMVAATAADRRYGAALWKSNGAMLSVRSRSTVGKRCLRGRGTATMSPWSQRLTQRHTPGGRSPVPSAGAGLCSERWNSVGFVQRRPAVSRPGSVRLRASTSPSLSSTRSATRPNAELSDQPSTSASPRAAVRRSANDAPQSDASKQRAVSVRACEQTPVCPAHSVMGRHSTSRSTTSRQARCAC